ncbi:hypothetical protein Esti_006177 [Eimeria stiedai]
MRHGGAEGAIFVARFVVVSLLGTVAVSGERPITLHASDESPPYSSSLLQALGSTAADCNGASSVRRQQSPAAASEKPPRNSYAIEGGSEDDALSFVELGYDPFGKTFLRLYHDVFRGAVREVAARSLSYVQTYASLRSLMVCNPIIGSLFSSLGEKRNFVKILDKVVKREPPKNDKQRQKELTLVLKTLGNTLGTSSSKIRSNPSLLKAAQHLIFHIREGKMNGLASVFEALNSDAVFTIANSLLYVGTSLGYALKPMVMFNLIFFPPLLAFTSGLAVAVGVACLTGFPRILAKAFKFAEKQVLEGISAAYKYTQLFRLRRDSHGVRLLKEAFRSNLPKMLAKLWQLGSYHKSKPDKSRLRVSTLSSEVLAHSFLTGVVDFARESSYVMEAEYLPGKELETIRCYVRQLFVCCRMHLFSQCEATYRYAERFSARLQGALVFISWMSFRDAITDLLLMVYNVAKIALQAQVWSTENASLGSLGAAFKEDSYTESFNSNVALKPRLSRDVHNITSGITGLVMFFELRKLYRWRPRYAGETTDSPSGQKQGERRLERQILKEDNEDLSLANQRFEAFADLDIPADWTQAAPELEVVDDSLLPAEKVLLERFSSERDYMMMSLLRRSVGKLISAFKSIFGKLEKIVKLATHRDRVSPCSLQDRRVCMNADEAKKTRLTILHVMLAAHMGVFMGPGGGMAGSPEEMRQDFLNALRDAAWVRYRRRNIIPFKGKRRWGLDLLIDYLFPEREGKHDPDKPMTEEDMTALENAGKFKLERLQCIDNGALFILTTDMGDSKVFRPVSPIAPEVKKQLCIYEHEFVSFNAWYQRNESESHLTVPGIAEIKGFLTDAAPILRSKQADEDVGHLIEAVLWSKGIQRIDARVASDLMVSTKRMLYPEKSWKEFFRVVSPVDLDYVQQRVSSGLQVESSKYTVKKPISPAMKADKIVNALAVALESTLIAAGSLRAGLQDLALITTGYLALEAIKLAEKRITGMTRMLKTFQERLWDEFVARKQYSPERKILPHLLDRDENEPQQQKLSQGARRVSISAAFAREEGHSELLFDDWCEEIYKAATNLPSEPGSANLNADDSGVIQCALLRFLGRRHVKKPPAKTKKAVFKYLHHVVQHLRKAKKTEKYSWRSYLNARPTKKGDEGEESEAVRSAIRSSFASLRKAVIRSRGRLSHRIRSMAAKKLFKRRVFNILRGKEFLQILQLAALEAFADPSLFPESVIIHPSTLGAFARLHIILRFEVAPIIEEHEGTEIVVQMKMMPASSPAMKRLMTKLERQMREAKQDLGDGYKKHVRRCAGYLSLLHISGASSGYIGPQLPSLFLRFATLVDKESHEERTRFLVTQRHLGFVEQASIKLLLKAKDALNLLDKSMKEPPAEPLVNPSLEMLSIRSPLHLRSEAAANELLPKLEHPSLVLFCKLWLPARDSPLYTQMYEASLMHLKELTEILETSPLPTFFQSGPNDSGSSLEFSSLEAVVKFVEDLSSSSSEEEHATELTVGFMLHAPFMKALEVTGLSSESVGDGFRTSPLQCMPENIASGVSFTLPVNAQSRLRMLSSMLLHLEDAENVVDSFQVLLPDATDAVWMEPIERQMGEEVGNQFGENVQHTRPQDFVFDWSTLNLPEGSEETDPGSFVSARSLIGEQQPQSQPPSFSENKGRDELEEEQPAAETPTDKTETQPTEADAVQDVGAEPDRSNDAFDVDTENWKNAKNTEAHLKQQLSNFEAHAFHFTGAFHTLLSAARLPSKMHASVLRTFRDILSVATIGEPRWRRRSWRHRLASVLRRRRSKLRAKDAKEQASTFAQAEKPSDLSANSANDAFYSWLLPASLERIGFRIRKGWKRLIATEFLSVRSAACEQEASSWRDTATSPTQGESATAAAAAGDEQQLAPDAVAPEATPQQEEPLDSRKKLCSLPLWLDLHARVTLEEQMLEEQQIFPYFVRMGIENVQLVHKAAQEALVSHLWSKLKSMKWLEAGSSLEQLESIRDKLQRALLAVSPKHPLLEVEPVRTLLVESTVDLLQQRDITVQRLQERIEGLQQTAVAHAAAHLIGVTGGLERSEAERAVGSLMEAASANSPKSLSTSSPAHKEGDAARRQHVLQAWLVQASLFKDALLLLSRPAIFTPAAALLQALHVITTPKTRLQSQLKKTLKKMRQLSSTSLDLLMRLPRAYIRLPQRHFYSRGFDQRISPVVLSPSGDAEKHMLEALIKKFPTRLPIKPRPVLA